MGARCFFFSMLQVLVCYKSEKCILPHLSRTCSDKMVGLSG